MRGPLTATPTVSTILQALINLLITIAAGIIIELVKRRLDERKNHDEPDTDDGSEE